MTSTNSADLSAAYQLRSIQDFTKLLNRPNDLVLLDPLAPAFQKSLHLASYSERIEMSGTPAYGGITSTVIPNRGDFLSNLTVCFTLPLLQYTTGTYANYTSSVAHVLPKRIELMLGEAVLDRLEGQWMECQDQVTIPNTKWTADCLMKGRYESYVIPNSQSDTDRVQTGPITFRCPLLFSFADDKSLALPLASLPFSTLTLRVTWNTFENCVIFDGTTFPPKLPMLDAWIEAEYTKVEGSHVTVNPKYNFHTAQLRYIIRQKKYFDFQVPAGATSMHFALDSILAPCAGLMFFCREEFAEQNNDWFNFSHLDATGSPIVQTARLTCDGTEIFPERDESFYRLAETSTKALRAPTGNQYLMSFSPFFWEVNKASGAMDFRKIKNTQLWIKFSGKQTASTLRVMAVVYNIMDVKKGQVSFLSIY